MTNYELHPLCTLFPRMDGDAFRALCDDIDSHGLQQPIVLYQGMIVDGGNRYRACIESGFEPQFVEYDGDDIVQFVLSSNLHRRHMTAGQQAAIVASVQDWKRSQQRGGDRKSEAAKNQSATLHFDSVEDRAATSGASVRTQKMADSVAKADPELAKAVGRGEVSLPKAVAKVAEQAGKQAKTAPKASPPPPPKNVPAEFADVDVDEAMSDIDALKELERMQADVRHLEEQIKALQVDDTKAELAKQIKMRQALEGRLGHEMDAVARLQRDLDIYGKWYAELRKITGKERRGEITALLKRLLTKEEA